MAETEVRPAKRFRSSSASLTAEDGFPNQEEEEEEEEEDEDEVEDEEEEEEDQDLKFCMQAETIEQEKEDDVKLESGMPAFFRVEDLDERLKPILSGISSKNPREDLIEFRKLLQNDEDGHFLYQYVFLSPKCAELMSVWSLGPGAEPCVPLLQLMEEIMKHPMGKQGNSIDLSKPDNARIHSVVVRLRLDRLARLIVTMKLKDIYAHLTSSERNRQRSALLLVASIARRGSSLASEIATNFDFSLNALPKLSKPYHNSYKNANKNSKEMNLSTTSRSVRSAYIEFALSFLEVSHAALLRWVLQIRPLYTGVFHNLSTDDENTILSVLSVLRDKVLDSSAMVPPGLQSAIFGDASLEQLAIISSNEMHSKAAQAANDTLLVLCTDPSHGICPDDTALWESSTRKSGNFGGGQGRLVRLMLKLRATESQNHRELLLLIAAGKPVLVAAYFDSFPYSLEPRASNAWFAAVSLISDIILVSKAQPPFIALATQGLPPPFIEDSLFQAILGSALPRSLTRLVINRGLLHANILVKHGCVRILLEVFSSVQFYVLSIRKASMSCHQNLCIDECKELGSMSMEGSLDVYDATYKHSTESQKWLLLEKHLQNELQSFSPDPQVLVSMFFSKPVLTNSSNEKNKSISKALSIDEDHFEENVHEIDTPIQDGDHREDDEAKLVDIWNADSELVNTGELRDVAGFLNAKILELLACYQRTIPMALVECSFDVFKLLPEDPILMTVSQQKALLMLLLAASREIEGLDLDSFSHHSYGNLNPRHLYRHLKSLLNFMRKQKVKSIKEQTQTLAYRAMISCGAFESNNGEIGIWLQFLPLADDAVTSFLCDSVDAVGRNIDKYVDMLLSTLHSASRSDLTIAPKFGPLGICVLDKCLRVLASNTKSFTVPQKTSISIYVANVLQLLLQSQVHSKALGIILNELLCIEKYEPLATTSVFRSEWSPLQSLRVEVHRILMEDQLCYWGSNPFYQPIGNGALTQSLRKALECCKIDDTSSLEAKASALSACLLCLCPEELVENFPLLMETFFPLFKGKFLVLTGIFGVYKWLLPAIIESWKDLFNTAIMLASSLAHSKNIARDKEDKSQSDISLSFDGAKDNSMSANTSNITAFSFSIFLLSLPFGVIFPGALTAHKAELLKVNAFTVILQAAISEVPPQLWLSTANSVLFWIDRLWKLHSQGSDMKCELEICISLLRSMILPLEGQGWLCYLLKSASDPNIDVNLIIEFVKGVLMHPVMDLQYRVGENYPSLTPSRLGKGEHDDEFGVESWLYRGRDALSLLDCKVMDMLKELLQWSLDVSHNAFPTEVRRTVLLLRNSLSMSCKPFLTEALCTLKEAINNKKTSAPNVFSSISAYIVFYFSSYIDIELIVDLSYTLLSRETCNGNVNDGSYLTSTISFYDMGVYFATSVFDRIGQLIQQKDSGTNGFECSSLLQSIYRSILELVITSPSEKVYSCLLSALDANYGQHFITPDGSLYKSSSAYLSICIHKMPMKVLRHLMTNISRTKVKIIFYLLQISHVFLAEVFEVLCQHLGLTNIRLGPIVLSESSQSGYANEIYTHKEMILMLPVVNWLIHVIKNEENDSLFRMVEQITVSYYKMITEVINHWNIFPTAVDMLDVLPFANSQEGNNEFFNLFGLSTPGQLVLMLKHCLSYHAFGIEQKKELFASILQNSNHLPIKDVNTLSVEDTVKSVSIIIVKFMMAKMLLMSDTLKTSASDAEKSDKDPMAVDGIAETMVGNCYELSDNLIQTLNVIFKHKLEDKEEHRVFNIFGRKIELFKRDVLHILEVTLLNELKGIFIGLIDLKDETQFLSLLKKFTKIVLRFRFGERLPMQVLRFCVSTRSKTPVFSGRYSTYGLELLVGHSEFAAALLFSKDISKNHFLGRYFQEKDTTMRSLSSTLYLLKQHLLHNSMVAELKTSHSLELQLTDAESKKLELLKFLRLLYFLKHQALGCEVSAGATVSSIEMLSLLLASYTASMSEVDKENLLLMQEIEFFEGPGFPGILGMDYLWGEAALKRWKAKSGSVVSGASDDGTVMELWKRSFKEDLILDPTKCALGVLFFPSQRKLCTGIFVSTGVNAVEDQQSMDGGDERLLQDAAYDPCFILPFALHCLSSGWMTPDDFVSKGLLALTLVSVSSADEDMRKLGYEILAKYFMILEVCENFKGKLQIRLLLTFLKNMVVQPWQRLPFITTLFAAEASCILMHPSDVHYPAISKFLLRAPGIDLETIPLFKSLFGSGSVHFRADRAWMLRLLAFGLRTSFDIHIYRRRFVLEIMMSFYSSPLADRHTREWIFQILQRASKLRSLVQYLIESTGFLSWLSSIICGNSTAKSGEYAVGISEDSSLEALQVFENALSWRSVKRWLTLEGFEELLKVVWLFHHALIKSRSFSETSVFIKPYLRILRTAFQLSLARRKYQSHLKFSIADFLGIVQLIKAQQDVVGSEIQLLALETILESSPPACHSLEDKLHLYEFGTWALNMVQYLHLISPFCLKNIEGRERKETDNFESGADLDGLLGKVLRWISSSLILGGLEVGIVSYSCLTAWDCLRNTISSVDIASPADNDANKNLLQLLINLRYLSGLWMSNSLSVVCACTLLLSKVSEPCGIFLKASKELLEGPLSQVSAPPETDISWRWNRKPSVSKKPLKTFEIETCSMLVLLFLQLVNAEEKSDIPFVVERLQIAFKNLLSSQRISGLGSDVCNHDLWKHLKCASTFSR